MWTGLLLSLLLAVTIVDLRELRIPDWANAALGAGGLAFVLLELSWGEARSHVATAAFMAAAAWLIRAAYLRLRGRQGLGLGDVKMLGAASLWVGPLGAPVSASAAFADEELKVAERFSGTGVTLDVGGEYTGMKLTVTGPDDYWIEATSAKGAPAVDLRKGGTLSDGVYSYQLSGATAESKKIVRDYLDNGRDREAAPRLGAKASGTFVVQGGSIVKFDTTASERQ